jgi:uncharacterized protein YqhQ
MSKDFLVALILSILFAEALVYLILVLPLFLAQMLLKIFPDVSVLEYELAERIISKLRPFGYVSLYWLFPYLYWVS